MKEATLLQVDARGDEFFLRLSFSDGESERTQLLRVREEEYRAVGEPTAGALLLAEDLRILSFRENAKKAYERAVKILASADNTRRALQRKLVERGFTAAEAESAVERLAAEGYLNEDEMLLRQFAVFAKRMWGPLKFMPSLLAKGFSREDIDRVQARAEEEGVYRADEIRKELFEKFAPADKAEARALLYRFGFRA